MFKILSIYSCWKKYIKCNIWRVAVRPSYIEDAWFLKVNKTDSKDVYKSETSIILSSPLRQIDRRQAGP